MPPKRKPVGGIDNYKPASGEARSGLDGGKNPISGNAFPDIAGISSSIQEIDDSQNFIENILISRISPDTKNMRPSPLPREVLRKFIEGKLDSIRAVKEFLRLSEKDPLLKFTATKYIEFGRNIAEHGQIKPITCKRTFIETEKGKVEKYLLETGEQRFWSILAYNASVGNDMSNLRIRAVVAPENTATNEIEWVQRQISENRKTTQMTEVTQAREIARLLLAIISQRTGEVFEESIDDENQYFRNVFLTEKRTPNGVWEEIEKAMGLTTRRMRQSLSILKLPSDVLDIANRACLSYRTLQEILSLPSDEWKRAAWRAANEVIVTAQENSGDDAQQLLIVTPEARQSYKPKTKTESYMLAYRGFKKISRAVKQSKDNYIIDKICDEIYADGEQTVREVIKINEELNKALAQRLAGEN